MLCCKSSCLQAPDPAKGREIRADSLPSSGATMLLCKPRGRGKEGQGLLVRRLVIFSRGLNKVSACLLVATTHELCSGQRVGQSVGRGLGAVAEGACRHLGS